MCFLDAKRAFEGVNHWTLAKKLLDRTVPLHIVKLFMFWYREQEFMVQWGNSLPMPFRCSNGIRQGIQLSPLLYNVYTDDLNHHLQATGVGCYVGGAWVNSLSYADDMVLFAPTVAALHADTLGGMSRICWTSLHCTNTTKTVCTMDRPKQSQGRFSTSVRLGNKDNSSVEEFRYLGHIMTADCRDDKNIKKQFRRQNAVGNMLVRKSSFAPIEAKIQRFSRIVTKFMDVHFGVIHCTLLENLLSGIVILSSVLLTSPDTPVRVWHLR